MVDWNVSDQKGRNDLIVEFVGLPGVGKTTVLKSMVYTLRSRGLGVDDSFVDIHQLNFFSRVLLKTLYSTSQFMASPGQAVRMVKLVRESCQPSLTDDLKLILNWLLVARNFLNSSRNSNASVRVFDQGLFQAVWSIHAFAESDISPKIENEVSALIKQPIHVFVLEAPSHVIVDRLRSRSGKASRLENLVGDHLDARIEHALVALEKVKSLIRKLCKISSNLRFDILDNSVTDTNLYSVRTLGEIAADIVLERVRLEKLVID